MFKSRIGLLLCSTMLLASCAVPTTNGKPSESVAAASGGLFSQSVKVKLKAAVIKGSGDIIPVARTEFLIVPYSRTQIQKDLAAKNNAGPEPSFTDPKYENKDCRTIGTEQFCLTNFDQYDSEHAAWEKVAYAGIDDEITKASNGLKTVTVTTDLSGEAIFEVPPGDWYVLGMYSLLSGKSNVYWTYVKFGITPSTEKIELSNDNGKVINLDS